MTLQQKEALNRAYFPTELITDNQSYIKNIVKAKEALDAAQETLKATKESIVFFKSLLTDFSQQVAAE